MFMLAGPCFDSDSRSVHADRRDREAELGRVEMKYDLAGVEIPFPCDLAVSQHDRFQISITFEFMRALHCSK